MAYSALTPAREMLDIGFPLAPSAAGASGAVNIRPNRIFIYCSSHGAADITPTGFFAGCGGTPYGSSGMAADSWSRSTANVGMLPGDVIMNVESSAGSVPGKVTWHAVIGSTRSASTGTWAAGYDCTVRGALISP